MQTVKPHSPTHRRRILATAALLMTLTTLQPAFSQTPPNPPAAPPADNPPEPPAAKPSSEKDELIVLDSMSITGGYSGSLAASADAKQRSKALVEVIMPEDIGKLPDVSIADSLTRLPGLTGQRVNGRNQQITIRGFSPDFSIGMLDGVEQATTNDNRAVEYDQYPSELVGGVVVYKTGQADLVGGLAGTVDLQTASPLSIVKRTIAVRAFHNWTGYSQLTPGVKKAGNSYTASYIDHFANGTEGIYIGYSHSETPYQGKQWSAWGYPTTGAANDLILGGIRVFSQTELLKRDGLVGVIESKPNDFIHSKIDLFYSQFDENKLLGGMQIPMAVWGNAILQPGYTVTNGLVSNYTLTNVDPVLEGLVTHWKDHVKSIVWNLDLGPKTDWPVKVQAGWSSATRKEEVLETYAGLGFNKTNTNSATLTVTQAAGPNPALVYSDTNFGDASLFSITDPQGWGVGTLPITGQEGYIKYFSESDIADSVKASLSHNLSLAMFKSVEVGVSYSERFKYAAQNPTGYLVNTSGQPTAPLPTLLGTTSLAYAGNLNPISWDAEQLVTSKALTLIPNPNPGSYVGDDFKVWEKITRPYIQTTFKGTIGSIPYEGNLGAKADFAQQHSTGLSAGGGTLVSPASGSATYANLLPTLNMILKLTDQDIVRLFLGREEQRPRMYDMRASRDFTYNNTYATSTTISPWGGSSGNPNLKPWLADAIDLGYEHYFADRQGYVSLALFQKTLKNYIYQQLTLTDFTGYNYTSPQAPLIYQGYTSTNQNGQGGHVRGLEVTAQVTSELLTGGAVKGFGLTANGLLVDSSVKPWGPDSTPAPLPNLSKKSGNITLYYERYGFSARVSLHYQSETREYITNLGVPNPSSFGTPNDGYATETPFHTIDAQIGYEFGKKSALKGLAFYLEGRNLNDAALIQYNNGDRRQLMNWQKYGASYSAGVSYKF